ncbi:hypothetical protein DFH28DRAFT_893077 [Melampsora americana]|nr:hypothetical protein DFH28DRAFT_893077 [Melampsora americana]
MEFALGPNVPHQPPQPQDANTTQQRLAQLLNQYDQAGGSHGVDILTFRDWFASVVPFSDPFFLPKFSEFGLAACKLDVERGRAPYQIGGVLPPRGMAIEQTPAFILPMEAFEAAQHAASVLRHENALRQSQEGKSRNPPIKNPLGILGSDCPDDVDSQQRPKQSRRRKTRRGQSKRRRQEDGGLSDSDSDSSTDDRINHLPFTKGENRAGKSLPPKAQAFVDAVKEYKMAGFSASVEAINRDRFRPLHFPFSLVQSLLRGFYICPVKVLWPDEYDAKKVPKPTDSFKSVRHHFQQEREWRRVIEIIRSAIIYAFPCTKDDVVTYFDHIFDMANLLADQGDWSNVVDYNARLRLAFATRPALTFSDFDHPELFAVRSMVTVPALTSARHQAPFSVQAASSAPKPYATKALSPRASKRKGAVASAPRAIWAGSIKQIAKGTPTNMQLCGNWNTGFCPDPCRHGRIHGVCDVIGCNSSHTRKQHFNQS